MGEGHPFLLGLGSYSKQAGNEGNLPGDIPFAHTSHLSLPDHVHHLVSLQRSPGRFHRKEAHPWFDQPFDEPVVLLNQVIEVFDLPQFHAFSKQPGGFEVSHGLGVGGRLINIDHARRRPGSGGGSLSRELGHPLLEWTHVRS